MAELKQELTNRDLKIMLNVTRTTIYYWRKNKKNKKGETVREGLKHYKLSGNGLSDPVRYRLEDVLEFCKKNGKEVVNPIYEQ